MRDKLYKLLEDSDCPAWVFFPNNAEMLKLAEYLFENGVVKVVRCKDCRYFYRDEEFNRAWCGYDKCGANEVAVNGYCYRGERERQWQ